MFNNMQPEIFRYYLRKENGSDYDYYYINSSGVVSFTTSSTPINPLGLSPNGWPDQALTWQRSFAYWGVIRAFTVPMSFSGDGAKIIRSIYYNQGVEGKLEFYIEIFTRDETNWVYIPYYQGEIDFSEFNSSFDSVSTNIKEGGFLARLRAHENSYYEYEVENNPDVVWVKMHGINLQFRQTWVCVPGETIANAGAGGKAPSFYAAISEGTNLYLDILDQIGTDTLPKLIHNRDSNPRTFDIKYDYNYFVFNHSGNVYDGFVKIEIATFNTTTNLFTGTHLYYMSPVGLAPGSSATYVGTDTLTIVLQPDEVVRVRCLLAYFNPTEFIYSNSDYDMEQINSKLTLTLDNKVPEGYIPTLRANKVYQSLISSVNDGLPITATSSLLSSDFNDVVMTSGDADRNLDNSIMKVNVSDFLKAMNCVFGTSFSYSKSSNTAYLEKKAFVLDNTDILDLGEISDLAITPFTEEMFSKLKCGYGNYTYDEVNGKDEFNNQAERQTPILSIPTDRDMVCPFRTDMYGEAINRLNLAGKEITDADSDNDIWMLHINPTSSGTIPDGFPGEGQPYFELYRDNTLAISNIYSPDTAYNFLFTPTRCIYRNGDWLHSIFDNLDSEYLKFQTNSKSNYTATKLVTDDGTTVIDEGADILIGDLDPQIFKPVFFEFRTTVPVNMFELMNSNPNGLITFRYKGEDYKGFIVKVSQQAAQNEVQQFKLLSSPDNDLTKLIY